MIALIERLSRGAQLVVHWAPGQESLIALGPQPIAIGTAPDAHVRLPRESGLPAVAATVALVDGRIEHEDRVTGRRTGLEDGSRFELGGTAMEVKAGR